jgi:hypothetical protein
MQACSTLRRRAAAQAQITAAGAEILEAAMTQCTDSHRI